jgi:hypothetical protein
MGYLLEGGGNVLYTCLQVRIYLANKAFVIFVVTSEALYGALKGDESIAVLLVQHPDKILLLSLVFEAAVGGLKQQLRLEKDLGGRPLPPTNKVSSHSLRTTRTSQGR